jgi:4-amino-4-deoxy-L-arabinose transferase-like glycosyltransferase
VAAQPGRVPGRSARLPPADVAAVLVLVVIGVVVPAVLAGTSHVFSIPSNDDWAYRRDLWEFVRTGHMSFAGWGAMTLVGQVLWGALFAAVFGTQAWAPGAAVAVLATAGLVAAYALARSVLSRGKALACALVVLALPGFALSTSSFMTDVPAFSAQAVCLAIAVAALRREGRARWGLLAAALAVGCFGFSVREFDIAAPLAAIGALALQDRRHRLTYGLATVGLVVACGGIYLWATHVPGAQNIPLALSGPVRFIKGVGNSYFTASLGLVPLLPAAVRRSWPRLSARAVLVAVCALVGGAVLLSSDHTLFNGNYLLQQGATGAAVLTGRPPLFPSVVWWALQLVALAGGALLAAVAATLGRQTLSGGRLCYPRVLLVLFSILTAIFLCLFEGLTKGTVFDRYLWPLDFSLAVLLLARGRAPSARAHALGTRAYAGVAGAHAGPPTGPRRQLSFLLTTAALSTVVAAVAAVVTLNADAYDAARWSAGDTAVAAGVPATMVDAGFEWVGSHQSAVATPGRRVPGAPFYDTWYDQMFATFTECAFVSGNDVALPWLRRLATVTYQELGFAERQDLYVYLVRKPGC